MHFDPLIVSPLASGILCVKTSWFAGFGTTMGIFIDLVRNLKIDST